MRANSRPAIFLIRGILGMDPQSGALWVSANVPANSVVQFHLRDAATSAVDLERTLTAYRASHAVRVRCRRAAVPPAMAAALACTARPITTAMRSGAWSRTCPSAAFSATVSSGPIQNSTFLHSYTSAFAVIHEKK